MNRTKACSFRLEFDVIANTSRASLVLFALVHGCGSPPLGIEAVARNEPPSEAGVVFDTVAPEGPNGDMADSSLFRDASEVGEDGGTKKDQWASDEGGASHEDGMGEPDATSVSGDELDETGAAARDASPRDASEDNVLSAQPDATDDAGLSDAGGLTDSGLPEADTKGRNPGTMDGHCLPVNCGTHSWACWPMPNSPHSSLPHPAKYTDMGEYDNVIRDDVTCLLWQKAARPLAAYTRDGANRFCEQAILDGVGWRLPTRIELMSIVDYSRKAPAITVSVFPSTQLNPPYWAWSPFASMPNYSYIVSFNEGLVSYADQSAMYYFRCVRGGGESVDLPVAAPPNHYEIRIDDVIDNYTGLTWQREDSQSLTTSGLSRGDAEHYCRTLNLHGMSWRLPSVKELATLVDESRLGLPLPTVDLGAFPTTKASDYWSSTDSEKGAWTVSFQDGTNVYTKTVAYARCVMAD